MMVNVTVFLELENWADDFARRSGVRVHLSSRALVNLSACEEIRLRKLEGLEQLVDAAKQDSPGLAEIFVNFGDGAEINKADWGAEFYRLAPVSRHSWSD